MGIYKRAPFWWKKYDIDPVTKRAPRKPCSTGIYVEGGNKAQTVQNKADALVQYQQDCIDIRRGIVAPETAKPAIRFRDYAPIWWRMRGRQQRRGWHSEQSAVRALVDGLVPSATGLAARPMGDYLLTELSASVIAAWRSERCTHVKASTANRGTVVLRVMLKHATDYLDVNPLAGSDKLGNKNWEKLPTVDTEVRAFTRDEFDAFIAAIDSVDAIHGIPKLEGLALTYAAVETLLRRGSLLSLTWGLDRGTHLVPLNAKVKIRRSPVTTNLRHYLNQLPKDTAHIFASFYAHARPGTSPQQSAENVVNEWFWRVCARAKVPCRREHHGVTFHSFRHTGATWLLKAGKNPRAVMTLGGWANANVFLKTYCHTDDAEVDAAAESLFPFRLHLVAKTATETP